MDPAIRQRLIARYREGPAVVTGAVAGLTGDQLDAREGGTGWSPREIVHHLADSEMTSAIRLRRLLAEERPRIDGYDEEQFARVLFYDRPIEASLRAVASARETSADILERLSDDQWRRAGTHSESGPYSVEKWLEIYAAHCHDHAAQIRAAIGRED